jgi:phosphatidylglycerol---prolipoprotein diacylglyceryl transferase
MQGRLFTIFDIGAPSYFILLVTGFIFATAAGSIWAKRIGQDPDVVVDLGLAMLLAGVAGARILHVIADGYFWDYVHLCTDPSLVDWKITEAECRSDQYAGVWDAARQVCKPPTPSGLGDKLNNCFAWAMFWRGGLAYYGGFVGASIGAWYLLKRDRFPFWKAADMAGMVVPIGLGFGRMGCLLAGCCFGTVSKGGWALSFPIYESLASFAIAALLILRLHGRKRYDGQVFLAFVGLYAAARFVLEFWRADDRGALFGLSTSQLIGAILIALAVVAHRARARSLTARAAPA